MTPMIDIVFLLIIFFMTVSQVTQVNQEQLELARQTGAEDQKPAVLTINLIEDGRIVVGGLTYEVPELIALLADELTQLGDDPTRLTVVLRVDRRVEGRVLKPVVEALANMDIRKVRFTVQVPE